MRFVLAIAAFVVAAVMIVTGIAQRTVFLQPGTFSLSATVDDGDRFIVVPGSVLQSQPGAQSIVASAGGDTQVFMSYGRADDITAWLGDEPYSRVGVNSAGTALTTTSVVPDADGSTDDGDASPSDQPSTAPSPEPTAATPTDDKGPDPRGSDLWLGEYDEAGAVIATVNLPKDIDVLIATDGSAAAPDSLRLSWPLDNATPWAGPLIAGGIVVLLAGIVLYLSGIQRMRRSRGPRRKGPGQGQKGLTKMSRQPKPRRPRELGAGKTKGGPLRRSLVIGVPLVLVGTLGLSGCSQDYWPTIGAPSPTPTVTATDLPADSQDQDFAAPVVTVPQVERIVSRISTAASEADAALDGTAAAVRFAGPALAERTANYALRAKVADAAGATPIPASPVTLTLPQATDAWPRTVMTAIQDKSDETVSPTVLVMTQEDPRSNYQVVYAEKLLEGARLENVAPATIGAASVPPDSKLLVMPPEQIAAAYADIITNGDASSFAGLFDADGDVFRTQVAADRATKAAGLPTTASIAFSAAAGTGPNVALATNDSGAIVAVNVQEGETVSVVTAGATVKPQGAVAALSGITESAKGTQATYGDQLLFYVPAVNSGEKITLLGFTQTLTAASELP
ncbi:hypothetical protein ITJ57_09025 [Plantibacter sp. VKM Ac-2880]|uniref:hypothetical protein n=1 Tax=Plantibacter sp. VKM Ac-2880 TaxID=2783827 RepID=UPI00188E5F7B|nr:hypothetical protein [Plantibacter sp. VKM Ac-2880]MBF4568911.1 hypothetical protein [Plantibacter sp. VKM Ac-2880]